MIWLICQMVQLQSVFLLIAAARVHLGEDTGGGPGKVAFV